jgi:hypothetical protein
MQITTSSWISINSAACIHGLGWILDHYSAMSCKSRCSLSCGTHGVTAGTVESKSAVTWANAAAC